MRKSLVCVMTLLACLLVDVAAQGWSDLGGGDHAGAPWSPAGGTSIAGVHTNVGAFTITGGATVSVEPWDGVNYGSLEIHASSVQIDGVLDAYATGFLGGAPGPSPGTYGSMGEGPGGGDGGFGSTSNIYGRGGGGGGYGGAAGDAGTGGASPSGAGGPSYGVMGLATPPPSDDDIMKGSGGGGGGQQSAGGLCTPGGNGGGRVILITSGNLTVTGTIDCGGETTLPTTATSGTGGGGSGGGILVQGDLVDVSMATFDASGGDSGDSGRYSGSGGGGGRIKIFWNDPGSAVTGTFDVSFGAYGATVFPPLSASQPGTIFDMQVAPPTPPSSWDFSLVAPTPDIVDLGTSFDVAVEIDVTGAVLGSYAATVRFDPAVFQATLVAAGSSPLGAPTLAAIDNMTGTIDLAGDNAAVSMAATGLLELAIISFTASGAAGDAAVIGATVTSVLDVGASSFGSPGPRPAGPAVVGIGLLLGDINRDGSVSILDALQMAQVSAGLVAVPTQRYERIAGDMDSDTDIDILDALQAAQVSAGLIGTSPVATSLDPYVDSITPPAASPLSTITVGGEVFSFLLADMTVTIGGTPATVQSAAPTSIDVEVPAGLPPGATTLSVEIDGRMSAATPFTVN